MGLRKFSLLMLASFSMLLTGCKEMSTVEENATAKLVEVANNISNNSLSLREDTAVLRSINYDKENDQKIIHIVAENERQTKPYFIKFTFNTNDLKCNAQGSVDSTLNAIIKNDNTQIYDVVAQETTYEILELMENLSELKGNNISKVEDGNNFYKYNINSIFYKLNENNTYDITFNTSVTNMHIDLIPTLIGEVTVLTEQYSYFYYINESTIHTNISTREDMNNYIVNVLESIKEGDFKTPTSNTYSKDYWNYDQNSVEQVIEYKENTDDDVLE